jgi:Cu/Ag efflux protein CusF
MAEELGQARARAERLDRELRAVRPAQSGGGVQQWDVRGVVRGTLPEMQLVVLTHEEIPGLMAAMTMAFRVVAPELLQSVRVGDSVRFTLRGTPPSDVVLTAIQAAK